MKRLIYSIITLSMLMFACNIATTPAPATVPPPTVTVPVATTDTAAAPTETQQVATDTPSGPQANVICNELSLYVDPVLASGYECKTVDEAAGADLPAFAVNPQYTEVVLTGYALADRFMTPHIDVFPYDRFAQLLPDLVPQRKHDLLNLLLGTAPGTSTLPLLPVFNAAQEFYSNYLVLTSLNGAGIRYLTLYGQAFFPVNNHDDFYSFQGMTSDAKYWISAILPISNPILPADGTNLPAGYTWDQVYANPSPYFTDIVSQLNGQSADSFSPTLGMLDGLIASINIQP